MNADWAKGRNERTGLEGIFPRSYVNLLDDKPQYGSFGAQPRPPPTNYGNLPLDVSQSGSTSGGGGGNESKLGANGKKFGKKLGNASQSAPLHPFPIIHHRRHHQMRYLSMVTCVLTFFPPGLVLQQFSAREPPSARKSSTASFRRMGGQILVSCCFSGGEQFHYIYQFNPNVGIGITSHRKNVSLARAYSISTSLD